MSRTPVRYRHKSSTEDKVAVAGGCAVLFIWLGVILVNMAFWGVLIWAILKVVNHYF